MKTNSFKLKNKLTHNFTGCNLSPILFCIFINNLGIELNTSGLGIDLASTNISAIFFADDLVLLGKSKNALNTLMEKTRIYFSNHRLQLSENKSKIMTYDSATGKITFPGSPKYSPVSLDQVIAFKYLGIPINCSPRCLFKSFNDQVKKKASNYLASVLSLVKSGPDRSAMAYTLWTRCALPSILYGSEVMPLTQATISEIEKCQTQVGKFILQLPRNSADVSAHLDAGLKPIWAVVAEKVLIYAHSTMGKPSSYWPKMAMNDHISIGSQSPYTRHLLKWKTATDSFGLQPAQIRASVKHAAIVSVLNQQRSTCVTTFAMNGSGPSSSNCWFKPKLWVTDSGFSKIISQFRACNIGLGNRAPTTNGQFFKLCPLCAKLGKTELNNEVTFPPNL